MLLLLLLLKKEAPCRVFLDSNGKCHKIVVLRMKILLLEMFEELEGRTSGGVTVGLNIFRH